VVELKEIAPNHMPVSKAGHERLRPRIIAEAPADAEEPPQGSAGPRMSSPDVDPVMGWRVLHGCDRGEHEEERR
jgi:hypothetical protein